MSIHLETSKRGIIENFHDAAIPKGHLLWFRTLAKRHPWARPRSSPSPIFNCHGLTFASRRTKIIDRANIMLILEHDEWREIDGQAAEPGDIVIYYDEAGDPNHSGMVVE